MKPVHAHDDKDTVDFALSTPEGPLYAKDGREFHPQEWFCGVSYPGSPDKGFVTVRMSAIVHVPEKPGELPKCFIDLVSIASQLLACLIDMHGTVVIPHEIWEKYNKRGFVPYNLTRDTQGDLVVRG